MTDREYRLRARIDRLADEAHALRGRVENLERVRAVLRVRAYKQFRRAELWRGRALLSPRGNYSWADRECAACGCHFDDRTPGCGTCNSRHYRRRKASLESARLTPSPRGGHFRDSGDASKATIAKRPPPLSMKRAVNTSLVVQARTAGSRTISEGGPGVDAVGHPGPPGG